MQDKEHDLEQLGIVLAVTNQINKDMLDMLREQQTMIKDEQADLRRMLERQQIRQWGIILCAIAIIALPMALTYMSFNKLSEHVDRGVEVLRYEHRTAADKELYKSITED